MHESCMAAHRPRVYTSSSMEISINRAWTPIYIILIVRTPKRAEKAASKEVPQLATLPANAGKVQCRCVTQIGCMAGRIALPVVSTRC